MDLKDGPDGHLSALQAAAILGVSPRHVRRLIATGQLAGDTRPYRTHRDAVDAYRRRQQGLGGDVVDGADHTDITPARNGHPGPERDTMAAAFAAALAELGRAREQVAALAREVGRREAEALALERQVEGLYAQLDDRRCQGGQWGQQGHGNGHGNGHRGGALARLGPWLRR